MAQLVRLRVSEGSMGAKKKLVYVSNPEVVGYTPT